MSLRVYLDYRDNHLYLYLFTYTQFVLWHRFFNRGVRVDAEEGKVVRYSLPLNSKDSYKIGYMLVAFYFVNFILPFAALVFMTVKLIQALRKSAKRREDLKQKKKNEEEMNLTLVAVVILFLICQLAIPIRRLCVEVIPSELQKCGYPYFYLRYILSNLPAFNSAVNFLLYVMFSKSFRNDFQRIILRKKNMVEPATQEVTNNTQNLQLPGTTATTVSKR